MSDKLTRIMNLVGELTEDETLDLAEQVYSQLSQENQDEFFDWMEQSEEDEEEEE